MVLKKSLKSAKAQMVVEYAAILLIILGLFTAFLTQVKGHLGTYHNAMIERIATR